MAVPSALIFLILSVRGFLRRIFRAGGAPVQALKQWIFRRLSSCWPTFVLGDNTPSRDKRFIDPPSLPRTLGQSPGESIGESDGKLSGKQAIDTELEYTPIIDGEKISLHEILPSIYPHSGEGIHSASRSSKSLRSSRSAHSLAVSQSARTPAQSMYGGGSERAESTSSINHSFLDVEGDSTHGYTVSVIGPDHSSDIPASPPPHSPDDENLAPVYLYPNPTRPRPSSRNEPRQTILTSNDNPAPYLAPVPSPRIENDQNVSGAGPMFGNIGSSPNDGPSSSDATHEMDARSSCSEPYDSGVDVISRIETGANERVLSLLVGQSNTAIGPPDANLSIYDPIPRPYLNNKYIVPIMPESMLRYSRRPTIRVNAKPQPLIPPLTTKFREFDPKGWETCLHPEGARYYFNRKKRIYAEANLQDGRTYAQMQELVLYLEDFIRLHKIKKTEDRNTDLVIWLRAPSDSEPNGKISTYYYYVHHPSRSIFFLDGYRPENLPVYTELPSGPTSQSHLAHEIESQYWFHCQFFPHSSKLTNEKVQELRGVVLHFIGDTTTSPKCSTAPYALDDLYKIFALTSEMERNLSDPNVDSVSAGSVGAHSCFARIMFIFTRARFLHFHGEAHARLDRTVSAYGDDPHHRTPLVRSLSWILFFAPDFHLRNLQCMWVDGITHKAVFQEAIKRMNDEWDQFVLFATVILAANVGFWSIQGSDHTTSSDNSAAQISSYVSAYASIGSIVVGLLLKRQNQTKMRETVVDFEKYMTARHHKFLGLETLAILYSLPYALLMWGMLTFSLALSLLCFMNSDKPTIITVGIAASCCSLLIFWCVVTNWEKEEKEYEPEIPEDHIDEANARDVLLGQEQNGATAYELDVLAPNPQSCQAENSMQYSETTGGHRIRTWSNSISPFFTRRNSQEQRKQQQQLPV